MKLVFQSRDQANKCINNVDLHEELMTEVKTPRMLLQRFCVIYGMPIGVTPQEIYGNAECEYPILNIQRLKELPEYICVFRQRFPVEPKIRKVRQCGKCFCLRHSCPQCYGQRKCRVCAYPAHQCECSHTPKCANCESDSHLSGDNKCENLIQQQNINKIIASENITYRDEAVKRLVPSEIRGSIQSHNTYAKALQNSLSKTQIIASANQQLVVDKSSTNTNTPSIPKSQQVK